ncbi:MAG TPA: NTP transferase domain-containing protein [Sphingomonas sp.]|nr:NTP transferase domain-containing protein [Sphingomonas sp.]
MRVAIVLAAGASRRFGRRDKLGARLRDRSLLDHALANASASGARRVILVSSRPVYRRGIVSVRARQAHRGLSASLAAGLAALRPIEREVLIFLADMPFARAPRMTIPPAMDATRPSFAGLPGHPVLVRVSAARARLAHDDGGLALRPRTAFVRGGPHNLIDIDTPAELRRMRGNGSYRFGPRSRAT